MLDALYQSLAVFFIALGNISFLTLVTYHGHGQHVFMGLVIIIWSWSLQLEIHDGQDQLVFVISDQRKPGHGHIHRLEP